MASRKFVKSRCQRFSVIKEKFIFSNYLKNIAKALQAKAFTVLSKRTLIYGVKDENVE